MNSGVVTSICLAVGLGIDAAVDKQLLSTNVDPLTLSKHWAYSLLPQMKMVKPKIWCVGKTHITDSNFEQLQAGFLSKIKNAVTKHIIHPEFVYNWGHTGMKNSEYDQDIPHSQTADKSMAHTGRATQQS